MPRATSPSACGQREWLMSSELWLALAKVVTAASRRSTARARAGGACGWMRGPGQRLSRALTQCTVRVKDGLFREKVDGFCVRLDRGGESTSFEIFISHHLQRRMGVSTLQPCQRYIIGCTFSFSAFSLPMRCFALAAAGELGDAGVASGDLGVLIPCGCTTTRRSAVLSCRRHPHQPSPSHRQEECYIP
jgi:hypothetical protein